jgi:hypothetical protein
MGTKGSFRIESEKGWALGQAPQVPLRGSLGREAKKKNAKLGYDL